MKITKTMRFLLVALAAAMVFSLFACADTGDGETTAPQGNETTEAPGGETTAPTGNETTEAPGNETTAPVGGDETDPIVTTVTYTVTVTDTDGNALAGAIVQLCVGDSCMLPVATDANGVATLELAEADYTVKVTLGGYTGEASYTFPEGSRELSVVLTKDASGDTTETTAPAGGDTTETTAPAGGDTTETTAPAGGDTTETTAPAGGDDTTETTAPAGGDVTEPVAGETKDNPIYVDFAADMTATVTVPAGKTYYFSSYRNIGGMLLSINGGEGTLLEGSMWAPPVFSITNEGAEDAEYALALTYPVGTQMNPEAVEDFGWIDVTLEEGDYDGYYYSYTAEADGTLTLYFYSQPDEVTGNIIVTNMNTYAQKTLLEDGVDNYGLELVIEVKAGDAFVIQVIAEPVDFVNPAAEFSWGGMFTYPLGTENNPIAPDVVWNDEYTAGSVTVTAPVGTTYYTISASGAFVTVNGGEPFALSGSVFAPPVFSITNEGEAEAEYVINVYYPAGHFMNPIVIESIEEALTANVGENTEVYYKWYATADGLLSVTTTNALASIKVNNNTQNIYGDSVDGAGTSYTPIAYGDDVQIVVTTVMDEETWTSPAAEVDVAFATEPATMVFDTTVTVTVNPGKPTVIGGYWGGMIGTIANAENINVRCDGGFYWAEDGTLTFDVAAKMGRMPSTVVIYNTGDEAAEITIEFTYPVGSFANPEPIFNPTNVTVSLAFGDEDGHYYKWIAQADGTLTLACPTVEDVEYDVVIMNNRSYAQRSLVNDGADGKVSIDVKAGDEIIIQVLVIPTVADWGSYVNELNTTLKGSFEFAPGTFENPDVIDSINEIVIDLAEGDKDGYYYQWTADKKGLYTFTAPENAGYDVRVTINSVQKSFAYDAVNGYLTISVKAGDVVEINVVAIPQQGAEGEAWTYPAVDTTVTATFSSGSAGGNLAGNVGVTVAPIDNSCNPTTSADGVTLSHKTGAGKDYFRFAVDFKQESTPSRYIAITYKSNGISGIGGYFYGCKNAEGTEIDFKDPDTKVSGSKYSFIDDGEWHTIIIDTHEILKSNHISEGYYMTKLRFQCSAVSAESTESFTIKSVELSNDLEYLNQKYQAALGSVDRPEVIDSITEIAVDLEAGNKAGYYYQWTADKKGIYTFAVPADAAYTVTVTANGSTTTAVNGYVSVYVVTGNTILINVKAVAVEGSYPAVDTTVTGLYSYGSMNGGLAGGNTMTGDITVFSNALTGKVNADGVTYSYNGTEKPRYVIQIQNRTESERYMAITYKSNGFVNTFRYFCGIRDIATGAYTAPSGNTTFNSTMKFEGDGEWHTIIIDTWALMTGTAIDGNKPTWDAMNGGYRLEDLRIDFNGIEEGASFTVKSIEFSNDIDYLEAKYN